MNLELKRAYEEIEKRLRKIAFEKLWPYFYRFDFALYNQEEVYFNGSFFPKTDQFIGNTTINYQGHQIAIWFITSYNCDYDILTSKIIHEMFHAFQTVCGELRFPNEIVGLNYPLDRMNYTIKYQENLIITKLVKNFQILEFDKLFNLKRLRKERIGHFFDYEEKIQIIEGMPTFVEMLALKTLSEEKYSSSLEKRLNYIQMIDEVFDVRKISYDLGALILMILTENNIFFSKDLKTKATIYDEVIKKIELKEVDVDENLEINLKTDVWLENKKNLIYNVLTKASFSCDFEGLLIYFDPYNAKKYQNYIYHPYFIGLQDESGKIDVLYGTFVTQMKDDNLRIEKYYKL